MLIYEGTKLTIKNLRMQTNMRFVKKICRFLLRSAPFFFAKQRKTIFFQLFVLWMQSKLFLGKRIAIVIRTIASLQFGQGRSNRLEQGIRIR